MALTLYGRMLAGNAATAVLLPHWTLGGLQLHCAALLWRSSAPAFCSTLLPYYQPVGWIGCLPLTTAARCPDRLLARLGDYDEPVLVLRPAFGRFAFTLTNWRTVVWPFSGKLHRGKHKKLLLDKYSSAVANYDRPIVLRRSKINVLETNEFMCVYLCTG